MSQTGTLRDAKSLSANLVQGNLWCGCGQQAPGHFTLQKGSVHTWTCTKCKQKVAAKIPK